VRNVALDGQHAKSSWPIACLEIVAKARYFSWTQGFCDEICPPHHKRGKSCRPSLLAVAFGFELGAGGRYFTFS
jgi:hypothetical protein